MGKKKTSTSTKAPPSNIKKVAEKIGKPVRKQKQKNRKNQQQLQDIQDEHELQEKSNQSIQNSQDHQSSSNGDQSDSFSSDEEQGDSDQSESSITPVKPENFALKQMQFREKRGTKMNYLMTRKKQQEEDPFWAEHKGYFGDLNAEDDEDQEDYVESSSGKDEFDSDFGQTQSEHQDQQQANQKKVEQLDEEKQKQKKRRMELMKKVNPNKQKSEKTLKVKQQQLKQQKKDVKNEKVVKKLRTEPKIQQQIGNRFIHQMFTQQQLLGEAAHTEYYNWLSLKKLISIETQKKDFTKKTKHVDGSKIIFRDKLKQNGGRESSYQLSGVQVNQISDLTMYWQAK